MSPLLDVLDDELDVLDVLDDELVEVVVSCPPDPPVLLDDELDEVLLDPVAPVPPAPPTPMPPGPPLKTNVG